MSLDFRLETIVILKATKGKHKQPVYINADAIAMIEPLPAGGRVVTLRRQHPPIQVSEDAENLLGKLERLNALSMLHDGATS